MQSAGGCNDHHLRNSDLSFFCFPEDVNRKNIWFNFCKRINLDGSKWEQT